MASNLLLRSVECEDSAIANAIFGRGSSSELYKRMLMGSSGLGLSTTCNLEQGSEPGMLTSRNILVGVMHFLNIEK